MNTPAGTISLEPELKAAIINYCAQLESGINATHKHLLNYVQLEGSTGMLTKIMFSKYVEGRENTLEVFDAMEQVVACLREQFAAACTDFETYEDQVQSQLDTMAERIAELEALLLANGGGGGGGGGFGGGGGGGYGGGGFTPPPTPEIPQFGGDEDDNGVEINITIDADGNVDVDVDADGDDVEVNIDIDTDPDNPDVEIPEDSESETPPLEVEDNAGGVGSGGGGGGGSAYVGDPTNLTNLSDETLDGVVPKNAMYDMNLTPAERAQRESFYERLWEEQSDRDPLGRSASELRLAWEHRDPMIIDPTGGESATVGYTEAKPGLADIHIPWGVAPARVGASV